MSENPFGDEELDRMIYDANEHAHKGRLERLRFLFSLEGRETFPVHSLAYEFYLEARLCWYVGAFISAIVMSSIALEELLRANYRAIKGVGGHLNSGKKIDEAGFADLIDQAEADGWLTSEELRKLHNLRKYLRNPWVHPPDIRMDFLKPNWLRQDIKIKAPDLGQGDVQEEAKEAIKLLITKFPEISQRFFRIK